MHDELTMSTSKLRFLSPLLLPLLFACGELRVENEATMHPSESTEGAELAAPEEKADRSNRADQAPIETGPSGPATRDDDMELEPLFNYYGVDYLAGLPTGEAQRDSLCERGFQDRFSRWYCGADAPTAGSLDDLLVAMDLKELGEPTPRHFAVTGHSSSLVMKRVSSINPRVVYFSDIITPPKSDYIAMGYARGDFIVEVAAFDVANDQLNFYLVKAGKECEPNCTNADRFLPNAEIGWQDLTVYPAEDLRNTAVDCLSCHQPGGPDTQRMLRMQELPFPWTHWFATDTGSSILMDQFRLAHGENERYGTIPASRISESAPAALETFVKAVGFAEQPNVYDGTEINFDDPSVEIRGPVWTRLYDNAVAGDAISPPHYGIDPFDREKLMEKVGAYKDVVNQEVPGSHMPDMNDIFRDDLMDDLGFEAAEGLDAKGIVEHRCGTCHSGSDPLLSRDNFRVQDFPNNLSDSMKRKVVDRINLGKTSKLRMPPTLFSDLAPEQIDAIEGALE